MKILFLFPSLKKKKVEIWCDHSSALIPTHKHQLFILGAGYTGGGRRPAGWGEAGIGGWRKRVNKNKARVKMPQETQCFVCLKQWTVKPGHSYGSNDTTYNFTSHAFVSCAAEILQTLGDCASLPKYIHSNGAGGGGVKSVTIGVSDMLETDKWST